MYVIEYVYVHIHMLMSSGIRFTVFIVNIFILTTINHIQLMTSSCKLLWLT